MRPLSVQTWIGLVLLEAVFLLVSFGLSPMCRGQSQGIATPDDYSRERMEALWHQRTRGTNLALGKPVVFAPSPAYHLTRKGGTDSRDLVDGKLSAIPNQAIWWDEKAVGWNGGQSSWKTIVVDLGEVRPVAQVVWRVVAGCRRRNFIGPKVVRLSGSLDGDRVYTVCERRRWRDDTAVATPYHLPNLGSPEDGDQVYVYPIVLEGRNLRLRYVVLEFEMDGQWLASDELAVMAGEGDGTSPEDLPTRLLQTHGVWVSVDETRCPLIPGYPLPLFLRRRDLRPDGTRRPTTIRWELPPGVTVSGPAHYPRREPVPGIVIFTTPKGGNSRAVGPFYLAGKLDGEATLRLRAEDATSRQAWIALRLFAAELPEPFRLRQLTTSVGWMVDGQQMNWPRFEQVYPRLGFNTVPTFPRGWGTHQLESGEVSKDALHAAADPASLTIQGRRLEHLRAAGMKIVYMESPFHMVNWRFPEAQKIYKCQTPGAPPREPSFCPSYRGTYFQNEIERVADDMLLIGGADFLMWDWEMAGSGLWLGRQCSRCQKAFAAAGDIPWKRFVKNQTLDMLRALHTAVNTAAKKHGWKRPRIGLYNHDAVEPYCGIFEFTADGLLDFQNPSLYVGDHPEKVRERIRAAYRCNAAAPIIPWLTTGTCGYVPPAHVRVMLWEAMVNGASGITYYCFSDITPAQWLEMARALHALAAVEDVLVQGRPAHAEVTVNDPIIEISAKRAGSRMVILLTNPTAVPRPVVWHCPALHRSGKATVPAADAVLLHF